MHCAALVIRNPKKELSVECRRGGNLIEKYHLPDSRGSMVVVAPYILPLSILFNVRRLLDCELITDFDTAPRRCLPSRHDALEPTDPRARIYVCAGEPQSTAQLLHHHILREVAAVRHAGHDLRYGLTSGGSATSDRAGGCACVRLCDEDMARIRRWSTVLGHATVRASMVRFTSRCSFAEIVRYRVLGKTSGLSECSATTDGQWWRLGNWIERWWLEQQRTRATSWW